MRIRTHYLIFFVLFALVHAVGCASSAPQVRSLPDDAVSDPTERIGLLENAEVRAWEAESGIEIEEVYVLDTWREVRSGETVLNKTRSVAFVGIASEGASLEGTSLAEGRCYMITSDTFRHHLGGGEYRSAVDVRIDGASAVEVDCSGLPSPAVAAGDDRIERVGFPHHSAAACEGSNPAYRCTSFKNRDAEVEVVELQ